MEGSPRFREASIKSEAYKQDTSGQQNTGKKIQVQIVAVYVPDLPREVAENQVEK